MSQIPPAGGRLLQSLQSNISPSTQNLIAGTHLVPNSGNGMQTDPGVQVISGSNMPITPSGATVSSDLDEAEKLQIFDEVLEQIEAGEVAGDSSAGMAGDSQSEFGDQAVLAMQEPDSPSSPTSPQQTIVSALDPDALYQPTEDSGLFAQAIPTAVDQVQQEIQQQLPQVGGRQREHLEGGFSGVVAPELPVDIQYVEEEKNPELPPEVESYIQHVEETAKMEPQNIVIAQDAVPDTPAVPSPPRIVKVLPLTKEQEAVGIRKNPSFSIRWLVELGHKIAKALVGDVVYREN